MDATGLGAQYGRIGPEVARVMAEVVARGQFILGPEVAELERRLAGRAGAGHCLACASGTDALLLPLMAWGIGPGDAVFVPDFTFFATAEVVSRLGATPVFVDIDPVTFNLDAGRLGAAVEAVRARDPAMHPLPAAATAGAGLRPRAVIPVDLFGLAADYERILPVAARHGLAVLEDAAQSFGGSAGGRKVCGLGCHAAATSFFPLKPLGCYGDGGAVFTDDPELSRTLASLRAHGRGRDKYDNVRIGLNSRLDTLQAAVLLVKLNILDEEIAARNAVAARYGAALAGSAATPPAVPPSRISAWAQYSVLLPDRDAVLAALTGAGIPAAVYYPKPLHRLAALLPLGYRPDDFPVANLASERILALPMHPYLTGEDTDRVAGEVLKATMRVVRGT